MTTVQALLLGVVQGVTEFLPISSSGHLVLLQKVLGINTEVFTFDVLIHLATLGAIIVFFGRSLLQVTRRELGLLLIGTLPAALAGIVFGDFFEALFAQDAWLWLELIISGVICFYIDWRIKQLDTTKVKVVKKETQINIGQSLLIGIAQALAIIPGISRSGATVAGAVGTGLDRESAFRFSFLLAIPALAGAGFLEFLKIREVGLGDLSMSAAVVGCVAAFAAGLASLRLFQYVMKRAQLKWFGWYCVILGIVVLLVVR